MPELAEVETVRKALEEEALGKRIVSVDVLRKKNILTGAEKLSLGLVGATFSKFDRLGKHLIFHFSNGRVLLCHLRMEGKYFLDRVGDPYRKQDLVGFNFQDGSRLTYNDVRKFGTFELYSEDDYFQKSSLSKLGKEPFALTKEELYAKLQRSSRPIKEAIMDQTIIAGLGNIYADEVLFAARINPRAPAKEISLEQADSLLKESVRILYQAIALGGSTIKSYHPKEGVSGMMQNRLHAYGRKNRDCERCGTPMHTIFINGRSSTYCPKCQKQVGRPFVIAVCGPVHSGKSTVAKYLESKGYPRFDADDAVKTLYEEKAVRKQMKLILGNKAVYKGAINVPYISKQLSDKKKKAEWLGYLYPLVKEKAEEFILSHKEEEHVVLEVPLLYGSGLEILTDMVILVDASASIRENRIKEEGKDAERQMKLNKGYPLAYAKANATYFLRNDGDLQTLKSRIDELPLL